MKKLDEKIYLTETNEKANGIVIRKINKRTYEVQSNKIDERWVTYDKKTLNKLHKGLIAADKARCLVKGSITDALVLAYALRSVL